MISDSVFFGCSVGLLGHVWLKMANQGSSSERGTSLLYLGLSLGAVAAGLRWKYHVDSWAAQAFSQVNICSSVSEAQNLGDGAYVLFQGRAENPVCHNCQQSS